MYVGPFAGRRAPSPRTPLPHLPRFVPESDVQGPTPDKEAVRFDRESLWMAQRSAAAPHCTIAERTATVFDSFAPDRLDCGSGSIRRKLPRPDRPHNGTYQFT